jgi:hypothetical protein
VFTVPLATLVQATKKPSGLWSSAILSPEGKKRYFVVHGGLFSQDGVTLDDIRKLERVGRQPGQSGLMCECSPSSGHIKCSKFVYLGEVCFIQPILL